MTFFYEDNQFFLPKLRLCFRCILIHTFPKTISVYNSHSHMRSTLLLKNNSNWACASLLPSTIFSHFNLIYVLSFNFINLNSDIWINKMKNKNATLLEQCQKYHTVGTVLKMPHCWNSAKNTTLLEQF
jgi:hypothetical protein